MKSNIIVLGPYMLIPHYELQIFSFHFTSVMRISTQISITCVLSVRKRRHCSIQVVLVTNYSTVLLTSMCLWKGKLSSTQGWIPQMLLGREFENTGLFCWSPQQLVREVGEWQALIARWAFYWGLCWPQKRERSAKSGSWSSSSGGIWSQNTEEEK